MARTKKRRRTPPPLPTNVQRVRPPKTRLKALLEVLSDVAVTAERVIFATPVPDAEAPKRLFIFDAAVLVRACNALKSVRLLCEQAHWEFAAGIVRQLFELVLNIEHLAGQPDRHEAIFRYAKYGLMQEVEHQRLALLYDQRTGRPIDEQRLASLTQMLEQTFPEFRRIDGEGKLHRRPSWSGHTARYLAEASSHRLREDQYHLLFAAWSEQVHGAPAAVIENMFAHDVPVDEVVAKDDARIAETVTMAITLFLELWMLLPHVPQVDARQRLEWTTAVIEQARKYGAPAPASAAASDDAAL
jgi:Family of unknown function (DUF5677)